MKVQEWIYCFGWGWFDRTICGFCGLIGAEHRDGMKLCRAW